MAKRAHRRARTIYKTGPRHRLAPPLNDSHRSVCGCLITARGRESWVIKEREHHNLRPSCRRRAQRNHNDNEFIPGVQRTD